MQSSVCSKLKQQMYDFKIKSQAWDFGHDYTITNWGDGDLVAAGYSWPPRSYTCTFCKREFRSAQALGGHMNVHRRDRARLRQSPPPLDGFAAATGGCNNSCNSGQFSLLNLNLVEPNPNLGTNPNPSPSPNFVVPNSNPTLSSLLTKFPQFATPLPSSGNNVTHEMRKWGKQASSAQHNGLVTKDLIVMKDVKGIEKLEKGCGVLKRGEVVRLDLEIGLISESREELDLELRLGNS